MVCRWMTFRIVTTTASRLSANTCCSLRPSVFIRAYRDVEGMRVVILPELSGLVLYSYTLDGGSVVLQHWGTCVLPSSLPRSRLLQLKQAWLELKHAPCHRALCWPKEEIPWRWLSLREGFEKRRSRRICGGPRGDPLNLVLNGDYIEVPEIVPCGLMFVAMT